MQKEIGLSPSLVFVDQSGVKHITRNVFNVLTQAGTTDFLFFTASSAKWRFGDPLAPEIKLAENLSYTDVHRVLADKYREWAPRGMFIGHLSIKKKSNIYGLMFGSHAWRGMQKFLEIAWKLDQVCGEADYEMEADTEEGKISGDALEGNQIRRAADRQRRFSVLPHKRISATCCKRRVPPVTERASNQE